MEFVAKSYAFVLAEKKKKLSNANILTNILSSMGDASGDHTPPLLPGILSGQAQHPVILEVDLIFRRKLEAGRRESFRCNRIDFVFKSRNVPFVVPNLPLEFRDWARSPLIFFLVLTFPACVYPGRLMTADRCNSSV
jgi:hypothetical protein